MNKLTTIVLTLLLTMSFAWADQPAEPTEEEVKVEQQLEESGDKENFIDGLKEAKKTLKDIDEISLSLDGEESIMGMILGMVAIVLIFGGPIIIVAIALHSSIKKRRMMHETINNYIQAGQDIPPEVLKELHKQADPKSNLHKGLVMVGLGLGIMGFFFMVEETGAMGLGLIPLFIGLAQLVVWKLESKNKPNS